MSNVSNKLQVGTVGTGSANGATVTGNTLNLQTATSSQPGVVSALPGSQIRLDSPNGYGSSNTQIRRFSNVTSTTGSDITYADSATLGATLTINAAGIYAIERHDGNSTAGPTLGISLNSSQLTTNIQSITTADRLTMNSLDLINSFTQCSVVVRCAINDVIRPHDGSTFGNTGSSNQMIITQVFKF